MFKPRDKVILLRSTAYQEQQVGLYEGMIGTVKETSRKEFILVQWDDKLVPKRYDNSFFVLAKDLAKL